MAFMILAGFAAIILMAVFVICLLGAALAGLVLLIDKAKKQIKSGRNTLNDWLPVFAWLVCYLVFLFFVQNIIATIMNKGFNIF